MSVPRRGGSCTMRCAPPADVNLTTAFEKQPLKLSTARTPHCEHAWPTSWAMRFVTFAEFHVESAIRNQTFNDARRALEQSS